MKLTLEPNQLRQMGDTDIWIYKDPEGAKTPCRGRCCFHEPVTTVFLFIKAQNKYAFVAYTSTDVMMSRQYLRGYRKGLLHLSQTLGYPELEFTSPHAFVLAGNKIEVNRTDLASPHSSASHPESPVPSDPQSGS